MIGHALEVAIAHIIELWLPVLAGVCILYGLIKFAHANMSHFISHLAREVDSFSKRKRNTLSINFLGGLVLAAMILFYIVDTTSLHILEHFENKSPGGPEVPIVSLIVLLGIFFIACPAISKHFDP
jgi:hypothetical protein